MATKNPRLTIMLSPDTYEAITAAAQVMSRSKGAVISEVLDEVAPALRKVAAAHHAFLQAGPEARKEIEARVAGMASTMDSLTDAAVGMQSAAFSTLDILVGGEASAPDASAASPAAAGDIRKRKVVKEGSGPPPPNRGVGKGEGRGQGGGKVTSIRGRRHV